MANRILESIHESKVKHRRAQRISALLAAHLPQGSLVLDVGCGDGEIAHRIMRQRPDVRISGIDVLVRPDALIPIDQFDGQTLPYANDSFDTVVFADVIHHADDGYALLREASRVARKSVVIKDHLMDRWLSGPTLQFMDRVHNERYGVALPFKYWTSQQWSDAFRHAGLRMEVKDGDLRLYPWWAEPIFGRTLQVLFRCIPTD